MRKRICHTGSKKTKASQRSSKNTSAQIPGVRQMQACHRHFSRLTIDELCAVDPAKLSGLERSIWHAEMMNREEPLDRKLERYLEDSPVGPFLRHPFYVGRCDPKRAAWVHAAIENRKRIVGELAVKEDWHGVVFTYENAFRLEAFLEYCPAFDDQTFWTVLGDVWTKQEQLWPNRKVFLQLFQSARPSREHLMTPEERSALEALPAEVPVFRGFIGVRGKGLSWTLDRASAEWFARRFEALEHLGQPRVKEGVVRKQDILAYFGRRKEMEIVIDPDKVTHVRTTKLPLRQANGE